MRTRAPRLALVFFTALLPTLVVPSCKHVDTTPSIAPFDADGGPCVPTGDVVQCRADFMHTIAVEVGECRAAKAAALAVDGGAKQ